MKKLFLVLVAVIAVVAFSCRPKTVSETPANDSTSVVTDTVTADTTQLVVDTTAVK